MINHSEELNASLLSTVEKHPVTGAGSERAGSGENEGDEEHLVLVVTSNWEKYLFFQEVM